MDETNKRMKIITSHKYLSSFFNCDIVNKLVHLFDQENYKYTNDTFKISKYINNERKIRGLNDANITISSEIYGEGKENPTLFLIIRKNNIDLLHFTIHLTLKDINPKASGIIHFRKDIYKNKKHNDIGKKGTIYINIC